MEGKKSRKNNITDLTVDRISDLPDFILGHILSFLPTITAVSTSILSKRWKYVWVTVHSLNFYYYLEEEEDEIEGEITGFVRFVNRVLLLNGVGSLNKFRLTWNRFSIPPQIISWINTAITRNVHHLFLSIGDIDMPTSLFSCDSLRSLDFRGSVAIDDTTVVCLPRLESLAIDCVRFESEENCEKLISGCPILHHLNLSIEDYNDDYDDHDITCIISSASLRRLEIYFRDRCKLKLKASSLEHLMLIGPLSEIFVEESLSSIVDVGLQIHLDEDDFPNNSIVEAVRAFDSMKSLLLSGSVMQALSRATIRLSTEFKRLINLQGHMFCCVFQDFIQNSENLEYLCSTALSWPRAMDHPRWTTPLQVPRCLSTSLKKVCLYGYKGLEDERDMICYILKYGSVLEVVGVSCHPLTGDGERLKLLKEISEFPRKSPVCKVQFT